MIVIIDDLIFKLYIWIITKNLIDMSKIIKKIQNELLSNLTIEVKFEPTAGVVINVGEIFKIKICITNHKQHAVYLNNIEIRDNSVAKVVGDGLIQPNKILLKNERYISPEIKMKALSSWHILSGRTCILVNYDLRFDPSSIFEFETLRQEKVVIYEEVPIDS